jgi:peptidoglycan L-alanyl-D-glutamate endopeptidase CwlK
VVAVMAKLALNEIKENGIDPLVIETYRSKERQYYLYCKGRTVDEAVAKGVPRAKAIKYVAQLKKEGYTGSEVTWTLNTIHVKKQAMDLVPQRKVDGRMTAIWNSQDPQTKKIISTMSKYGFEAGANWSKNTDSPHFQVDCNLYLGAFKRGYTTYQVTLAFQKALNKAINANLKEDGSWGASVDAALTKFKKTKKYKITTPVAGQKVVEDLLSYL